ncbi:IS66 family insertion sequence element accessory protein TnpB [Ensifer canadensis]
MGTGVKVWLSTGYTDMRCGFPSLALRVQEVLKHDPLSDPMRKVDSDLRCGKVRLLNHNTLPWRQACPLQLTDPKRRPLSVPILAQFSSHWN